MFIECPVILKPNCREEKEITLSMSPVRAMIISGVYDIDVIVTRIVYSARLGKPILMCSML